MGDGRRSVAGPRARVPDLRARAGVARSNQTQEHLHRRDSAAGRSARRTSAHGVQSNRHRNRTAFFDQSQPAEHSRARRARAPDSARLRCAQRRLRLARRRLQPDRVAIDGSPLRRRSDAPRVRGVARHPRLHRAPDFQHRRGRGGRRRISGAWPRASTSAFYTACRTSGWRSVSRSARAEAKEITTAYFARFPSVRAYIDRTIEEARVARLRLDDSRTAAVHAGPDFRQLHAARGCRTRGYQRAAARQRCRPYEARDGSNRSRAARTRGSMRRCCCRFTTS